MSYATKEQLIQIAKAYCKRIGAEFIFVSDDATRFGYEDKNGVLVHRSFMDLAEELQEQSVAK